MSFNTSNNQITNTGFAYDAAGDMTADGAHTYTFDAEGNVTQIDGGSTATFTYDAENERVRRDIPGKASNEYIFNAFGQRASVWDATDGWASKEEAYWGSMPVELHNSGAAHYQQQDWLGTERMVTGYTGSVEGTYTSLPFGDGFQVTGSDPDQYHFASLDYEYKVGTNGGALAHYRMYYNTTGSWMSPDPYSGSYDFANPQSFDRYSYVNGSPLGAIDPMGRQCMPASGPVAVATCLPDLFIYSSPGSAALPSLGSVLPSLGTVMPVIGIAVGVALGIDMLGKYLGWWGHPAFHGNVQASQAGKTIPDIGQPQSGAAYGDSCTQSILGAVNQKTGGNFSLSDVTNEFANGDTTNLIISGSGMSTATFNSIQTGRYPLSPFTWITGYGRTLHITGQSYFDPFPATFSNSNIGGLLSATFTAHIDDAFPYNPFGAAIHGVDVLLTKLGFAVHGPC